MPGPYELYLIRHGVAEERGDAWPDDAKRPLTEDGMSRLRKAARGLARLGVAFDVVLTSPLVRARQTAEIVAGGLDAASAARQHRVARAGRQLRRRSWPISRSTRASRASRWSATSPASASSRRGSIGSRHPIEFKKGAVCRIDVETIPPGGPGELRWFLHAEDSARR